MNSLLHAVGVVMLCTGASAAQAEVSAFSGLDWSRFSFVSTGDVTYEFGPLFASSGIEYAGIPNVALGYSSSNFAQDDVTAIVTNTSQSQSISMSRSDAASLHGFSAWATVSSSLQLNGSGSLTISIPYRLDIGAEDGFVATGSAGIVTYSYYDSEPLHSDNAWGRTGVPDVVGVPWYINYDGTPDAQGVLAITLLSHGGPSVHDFQSSTHVRINSPVPEAETSAMLGLGLFALMFARRRLVNNRLTAN